MAKDDKTEAPTPKRKKDARKQGQIARSPELVIWAQVLAATFLVRLTVVQVGRSLRDGLVDLRTLIAAPDAGRALGYLGTSLRGAAVGVAPLAGGLLLVGLVGNVAQTGGFASLSMLKPKPSRLNPLKGVKRLLSPRGAWQGAKSALKVGALVLVTWPPLDALVHRLVGEGRLEVGAVALATGDVALRIARNAAMVGFAIAAVDYLLQRRRIAQGMRMTKREVRDEHRQSEGDPAVKGQIRSRQLAIGRNRMIASVADASVVIVNPTHVAVALRYEPGRGAPRLVAKGRGEVAARIREQAERHRVPIVRDVPLARTIEATVAIGGEIPEQLYEAVARVLAFLARLRVRAAGGGPLPMPQAVS